MTHKLISEQVDIYQYPQALSPVGPNSQITIGDLHGNAMKLMFLLVKHQIVTNLSPENYNKLVAIYQKNVNELTATDLREFNTILNRLNFSNSTMIRLIGDELADRGSNDYFTLKILEKLHHKHVPVEILLSNHSVEFIHNTEVNKDSKENPFPVNFILIEQAKSMPNMGVLIDKGLIEKEEVYSITEACYKPKLKVISYTIDAITQRITLYSHAPVDLNLVNHLAKKLEVIYDDTTVEALAATIDQINEKFQRIVKEGRLHEYYNSKNFEYPNIQQVFEYVMWNREYEELQRQSSHQGYVISYVHGHDSNRKSNNNIYNLDNKLGKEENHVDTYEVLCTQNEASLEARMQRTKDEEPVLIAFSNPISATQPETYNKPKFVPITERTPTIIPPEYHTISTPQPENRMARENLESQERVNTKSTSANAAQINPYNLMWSKKNTKQERQPGKDEFFLIMVEVCHKRLLKNQAHYRQCIEQGKFIQPSKIKAYLEFNTARIQLYNSTATDNYDCVMIKGKDIGSYFSIHEFMMIDSSFSIQVFMFTSPVLCPIDKNFKLIPEEIASASTSITCKLN